MKNSKQFISIRIAHTLRKRRKMTEKEINSLFRQGEGKDVYFAVENEIIHGD